MEEKILKKYKEDLTSAAENKSSRIVLNKGVEKARVFVGTLLENAEKSVQMYSHNLNSAVTDDEGFINIFKKVLENKNITFSIILNEKTNNEMIEKLLEQYAEANNDYSNKISYIRESKCIKDVFGSEQHFLVVDDAYFRIEEDIKGFEAYGSFGKKDLAKKLREFFFKLEKNCIK